MLYRFLKNRYNRNLRNASHTPIFGDAELGCVVRCATLAAFTDAATLLGDFFDGVERISMERGVALDIARDETKDERTEP